ncbi:MAG: response regulator [Deltaproteobacteria bacterium]|nr:response regulator [Deltaproteobacteria bacterium]
MTHIFNCVLLVEGDQSHADVVTKALSSFCKEIVHRTSLQGALSCLGKISPDLIVTEVQFSDTKGVEVIKNLSQVWPFVPIIVLTSSPHIQDAIAGLKIGARDFIVKAFDSNFHEVLVLSLARVRNTLKLEAEKLKLQADMEVLRIAIENSTDGLAVTDSGGLLVYSNWAFEAFRLGCGGKGAQLWEIFSDQVEKWEELRNAVRQKYDNLPVGAAWHTEIRFRGDKDHAFDLSLSAIRAAPKIADGAIKIPSECVVWIRNITENKRREKFQRDMLSTTTHDLKNPLSAILMSADLAGDIVKEGSKAADLLVRIGSSAQSAINMIDEFLSARRLQEGSFILRPAENDVCEVLQEAVKNFEPVALARQISLTLQTEKLDGQKWIFDRTGFQRVLGNLLSNAVKFTPREGSVVVEAKISGGALHVAVTDSGAGMAPYEVSAIFERFTRLDRHADIPGTGLGLFVVKNIVTAHGGTVEVTSRVGHGTTFEIILPSHPPTNQRGELISLEFA